MMTRHVRSSNTPTKVAIPIDDAKKADSPEKLPNFFRRGANFLIDAPVSAAFLYSTGHAMFISKSQEPFITELCKGSDHLNQMLVENLYLFGDKISGHVNVPDSNTAALATLAVGATTAIFGVVHEAMETTRHRPLTHTDNFLNFLSGFRQMAATAFIASFIANIPDPEGLHQSFADLASAGTFMEALPHLMKTGGICAVAFAGTLGLQSLMKVANMLDPDFDGAMEPQQKPSKLLSTIKEPHAAEDGEAKPARPETKTLPGTPEALIVQQCEDTEVEIDSSDSEPVDEESLDELQFEGESPGDGPEQEESGENEPEEEEEPGQDGEQEEEDGPELEIEQEEHEPEQGHDAVAEDDIICEDEIEDELKSAGGKDKAPQVTFGGKRSQRESGAPVSDADVVEESFPEPPVLRERLEADPFDF